MREIEEDEGDDGNAKLLKRLQRIQCRAFARLFSTPDGKLVLDAMKNEVGWENPHPMPPFTTEELYRWTGQRNVIYAIQDRISKGQRLATNPKYKDDESN